MLNDEETVKAREVAQRLVNGARVLIDGVIPAVVAHQGQKNRPNWCHVYVRLIGNTRRTCVHASRLLEIDE